MDSSQTRSRATPMMSITKDNDDGDDDDDDDDGDDDDDDDDDDDHQTSAKITNMTWLSSMMMMTPVIMSITKYGDDDLHNHQ